MKIVVAGPGCPRCQATERNVMNACAELNLAAEVAHVTRVEEFARMGVSLTPAVIVDGKIMVAGRVPTVDELKQLFRKVQG